RSRRRRTRVFRLVAARQPGVDAWSNETLRTRSRRFQHAGAYAEGELSVLPRRDPQPRRVAAGVTRAGRVPSRCPWRDTLRPRARTEGPDVSTMYPDSRSTAAPPDAAAVRNDSDRGTLGRDPPY